METRIIWHDDMGMLAMCTCSTSSEKSRMDGHPCLGAHGECGAGRRSI